MDSALVETTRTKPAGFRAPDHTAPLDLDAVARACPADATTRGMFFADIVGELKQKGLTSPGDKTYVAFSSYAQREFMELAHAAALKVHPTLPVREGIRRFGRLAYPTFAGTMVGRVMFGILNHDAQAVMRIAPRAYAASLSLGRAEVLSTGARHAHWRMEELHTFIDSYHVGVLEGIVEACGKTPHVDVKMDDAANGELWVTW